MIPGRRSINERGVVRADHPLHKRAHKDKLEVVLRKCPSCGHHKAFATMAGRVKCTKCQHLHK